MTTGSPIVQAFPLAGPALLILVAIGVVLVVVLEVSAFRYAFERLGFSRFTAYATLLVSLVGSYVNIPVGVVRSGVSAASTFAPPVAPHATIVAINVGGAVVPLIVSALLLARSRAWLATAVGFGIVTLIVHALARPVPGMGIAVPTFVPPIAAAGIALLLHPDDEAPRIAYVSGTLGTLVGADLLNLHVLPALDAPIASIGGAGTFDGVFLTGVVATLMVALIVRRRPRYARHQPTLDA